MENNNTFSVQHFDVQQLLDSKRNPTILLVGARGSGKSVLLKDLLYRFHQSGVPRVVVMSPTEQVNGFFSTFIPPVFIHSPISIEALDAVWAAQNDLAMRLKVGQLSPDTNIKLLLVLDDCAYDKKFLACRTLRDVFLNGRHSQIIVIVTLQYLLDLPVALRSNAEVLFFQREDGLKNLERIHSQVCSFMPFKTFRQVFETVTANYESMVVLPKVNCPNPRPEDKVGFYRGDISLDFKFGDASLWRYHERRYLSPEAKFIQMQASQQALREAMSVSQREEDDKKNRRRSLTTSSNALVVRKVAAHIL